MSLMTESKKGPVETLRISNELEITVGKKVGILEHPNCAGRYGTIVKIDLQERTYQTSCNTCGGNVFMDIRVAV